MTNSGAWPPTTRTFPAHRVLGQTDQFAVVGAVIPVALSIAALRQARPKPRIAQPRAPRRLGAPRRKQLVPDRTGQALVR